MNILIPMAGEGKRFSDAGYMIHKPAIDTTDRKTGKKIPMVVCATMDIPQVDARGKNVLYIDRRFHKEGGVEEKIKKFYPEAGFLTIDKLTEGQASTCLLAESYLKREEELLIAGCDNGMVMDEAAFYRKKKENDAVIFVYRHNSSVCENPSAYGWVKLGTDESVKSVSVKMPISDNPIEDYAVVATFWFKRAGIFFDAAKRMIDRNDRINGEFYVDQVMNHVIQMGYKVGIFEIERYIGWGTPKDYENYEKTLQYWKRFVSKESFLGV